jgi:hypothetical protein
MASLQDYWGAYLRAHTRPATRAVHYIATVLGIAGVASSIIWLDPWPCVIAIALGYVLAIGAHWFIERNQPLILANPVWGAVSDMRMCLLALTGRLNRELIRHGVVTRTGRGRPAVSASQPVDPTPAPP